MQPTEPSELQIDVTQMYQIIGMLTAENAALKLARANDAALIQQLMAAGPPPADDNAPEPIGAPRPPKSPRTPAAVEAAG